MQSDNLKSYLHFHLIVFIWGFTAVLGALIIIDAVPLVWYRMGLASIFVFIYIKVRGISLKISFKTFLGFAIAGLIIAVHWLTFFGAIKASNVSITLAMMSTGAFFTALLEPIFYKRKLIWYELLFGLIVVGALYIIFEVEPEYQLGIIMALFSAFLSAVFTLINGKFIANHNPTKISFYELSIGTLCITLYLAFAKADTFFSSQFFDLSNMDWIYIMILASFCTAYAFIAAVAVMKHLSPYTIMLTINLEPVYGIVLAFLILGDAERMSTEFYYGAIVILAVVVANGILKNRKRVKAVKEV
ncbi:DMT family transporter [Dokdonia sp. Hel_I_53]|uniref:DMT family transporter n=1 Tax=Dokdonia sp. Hel_I_53 TaxID=1566287 RepID=UPI0011990937|nr:DMT family transporter [Dokdonia sp. Hel_I_53]TVZ52075.1 EamA domain-containing membrane protein RarD [Dokdonia sp. Hel_I_53]